MGEGTTNEPIWLLVYYLLYDITVIYCNDSIIYCNDSIGIKCLKIIGASDNKKVHNN